MASLFFEVELHNTDKHYSVHDGVSNAVVFQINVVVTDAMSWTGVRREDKEHWKLYIISVDTDTPRNDVLVCGVRAVGEDGIMQVSHTSVALHADTRFNKVVKIVFNVAKKAEPF
jgi:hypothetical protein